MCEEAENAADEVIDDLMTGGHGDYTNDRDAIVEAFNTMLDGNDDVHIAVESVLPNLRLLQEDYYDQHMDEGDEDGEPAPDFDKQLAYCCIVPAYVFPASA